MADSKRLTEIAKSFPCLARAPIYDEEGELDMFKCDKWASTVASSGELHAARFVLNIWADCGEWECGPFILTRAIRQWDDGNRRAFQRWAADPVVF